MFHFESIYCIIGAPSHGESERDGRMKFKSIWAKENFFLDSLSKCVAIRLGIKTDQ